VLNVTATGTTGSVSGVITRAEIRDKR